MTDNPGGGIARKDHVDGAGAVLEAPAIDPASDTAGLKPGAAPGAATAEADPAAAMVAAPAVRPPWPTAILAAGACLLLILGVFSRTAWTMAETWWNSGSYGHGLLIVPLAAYMIWRRRFILEPVLPAPDFRGLIPLTGTMLLWLIGDVAGLQVVMQFALVLMLPAMVLTVLGWQVLRRMAFPLFFLLFAVPFGDFLIAPLQDLTAVASVRMLQWSGVPVYTDGLLIYIPTGSFIVAEACSGVRYLIVAVALGVLGAHLFYESWWRRALFVGLSFVVPVVANAIRAYGIVYIAHVTDHQYAVGVDHLIYGWIFLSLVTLLLLGIGMTFREPRTPVPDSRIVDWTGVPEDTSGTGRRIIAAALTTATLIIAAPIYARHIDSQGNTLLAGAMPPEIAGWTRTAPAEPAWLPAFGGASADIHASYLAGDGARVDLYVGYYRYQTQSAEVTNEMNLIFPEGWLRIGGTVADATIDGAPQRVSVSRIRQERDTRLAWSWYWVDDTFTDNRILAKLHEVRAKLLGGRGEAAIVAIAAPYGEDPAEAEPVLARFAAAAPIGDYLRGLAGAGATP